MANFTVTVTGSSAMADVVTQLNAWAAQLNGQVNNDNFDSSTFTADVSNVSDAADTKGCVMTGNVACDAGVTVDGVDVSELNATVTSLQTTVTNDVFTGDRVVFASGVMTNGQSILVKLQAVDATINDTDWDINYLIAPSDIDAADGGNSGTGIRSFAYTISSWVVTPSGTDENDTTIPAANIGMHFIAVAVKTT